MSLKPQTVLPAIASTLYAGGIDRLIDRAAAIVANAKRTPPTKRKPTLARTA